ncbi:MAG: TetR/AcrR family transcriptional regulator [Acidimicrobiia bacterium]
MSPKDRPAAIRRALRDLVAERGFHGASMSAVAEEAGVATGTAYVHYESKDELVFDTYLEIKAGLASAVMENLDASADALDQWSHILKASNVYLSEEPERARFLTQLEESPYYEEAHQRLVAAGDPLSDAGRNSDMFDLLIDLPWEVIYALSLGVLVRLIASGTQLKRDELETLVTATWRAVTLP